MARTARRGPLGSERAALLASSAVIAAVVVAQAPGRIVPETKLDVLLDPVRYLGRALSAWDPSGGFGRVQNQAAGYLFPMGAWYALADLLHLPPWLAQRAWIALVVLAALWGAHRLAGLLGVGSAAGRLVAGWAYALAPATTATAAFQSAGQLPYSLAPWVLVPLVGARAGSSPRRAAAWSGLAVLAMGGVNGAAAFAVLPLALLWFLAAPAGRERRRLFGWWVAALGAATLWWVVPLAVSIRYGVRFTAFTETPNLTSSTESATEILRGTGNWLAYLPIRQGGYWLPGARAMAVDRVAIVGSVLAAAAGLVGLARRDAPGRNWLGPAALLGALATGIAYAGSAGGSFATVAQHLLAGPLAPFRNVHKFAAVVRLPLAVGLGHLVAVARAATPAPAADRAGAPTTGAPDAVPMPAPLRGRAWIGTAAPVLAVVAIVLAVAPAVPGRLTAPGSFADVPPAWRDAVRWLDRRADDRRTLLVPGSGFGEYRWGRPLDEPISSIAHHPWAVRDLIPLGGNGSTRLLDGLDTQLLGDHLPDGFTAALQRAGVGHLLVRNDLDLARTGGPGPAAVRRLLETAGLRRVRSFGPRAHDRGNDGRLQAEPGDPALATFRQLDVYEVPQAVDRVAAYPARGPLVVGGGPEAVAELPAAMTDGRAVVLAVDEPAGLEQPVRVATDTARRRDVEFGGIRNNATYTLTPDERSPYTGDEPLDRWPADEPVGLTSATVDGAATIRDDPPPRKLLWPERQPGSAFDGDPATAWVPDDPATGHWVEVTFDRPRSVPRATIVLPAATGERIGSVTVTTDGGTRRASTALGRATVALPPGPTRRVRVTVDGLIDGPTIGRVGIAEVRLAGVSVRRSVVAAPVGRGGTTTDADAAVLVRQARDRFDRYRRDEEGILDRHVRLAAGRYRLHGTASAHPGVGLDAALAELTTPARAGATLEVRASSTWHDQPAFGPDAAVDGDRRTAWIADAQATPPRLTLAWTGRRTLRGVDLTVEPNVDVPTSVAVTIGDETTSYPIPPDGTIRWKPVRADQISFAFPASTEVEDEQRLIGLREVRVLGLDGLRPATPADDARWTSPCGFGPDLRVDGERIPTRAVATASDLREGTPVRWEACRFLRLRAGAHHVEVPATGALRIDRAVLAPAAGVAAPAAHRTARPGRWGATDRSIRVGAGPATIVATTENANDGWEATLDGHRLAAVRVDGWRQGWLVPAGRAGTIELRYVPDRFQQLGLAVALLAALGLVAGALVPARRRRHATEGDTTAAESAMGTTAWTQGRPWPEAALLVLAAAVGVGLAGPLVVVVLPLLAIPRRAARLPWVAGALAVAAGAVAFAHPHAAITTHVGSLSWPAQLLATAAWLALAAALVPDRRPQVPTDHPADAEPADPEADG